MSDEDAYAGNDRSPLPPEDAAGEAILSEGVGGVPDIPEADRATVGDPDDDQVDTDEPQIEPSR